MHDHPLRFEVAVEKVAPDPVHPVPRRLRARHAAGEEVFVQVRCLGAGDERVAWLQRRDGKGVWGRGRVTGFGGGGGGGVAIDDDLGLGGEEVAGTEGACLGRGVRGQPLRHGLAADLVLKRRLAGPGRARLESLAVVVHGRGPGAILGRRRRGRGRSVGVAFDNDDGLGGVERGRPARDAFAKLAVPDGRARPGHAGREVLGIDVLGAQGGGRRGLGGVAVDKSVGCGGGNCVEPQRQDMAGPFGDGRGVGSGHAGWVYLVVVVYDARARGFRYWGFCIRARRSRGQENESENRERDDCLGVHYTLVSFPVQGRLLVIISFTRTKLGWVSVLIRMLLQGRRGMHADTL